MPAFATPPSLSRRRLAPLPAPTARPTITLSAAPPRKVFFVLGNAGSGKGTQCALLVDALRLAHISAGDLLRAEVASGSARGREIGAIIADGKIVPGRVTLDLLGAAIDETDAPGVLVDGFPRNLAQAQEFTDTVSDFEFALYFDCPEDELMRRLMARGRTSGRTDDNEISIRKRFRTFEDTCRPVIDRYREQGRVVVVDSLRSVDDIFYEILPLFEKALNIESGTALEGAA